MRIVPILRYRDPAAAVLWLCQALGFDRHFVAEEGGKVVHAQLRFEDSLVFLGPDRERDPYGMHSPLALNGTNQCVYLVVPDGEVDRHCMRARAHGAVVVTEPYATSYGGREYSCRDPEGHVWSVGSYAGEPLPR